MGRTKGVAVKKKSVKGLKLALTLTDAEKAEICRLIAEDHLTLKQACYMVGADPGNFSTMTSGDDPAMVDLSMQYQRAKAQSVQFWVQEMILGGREKNNARVKGAESMLRAQDQDRFREKDTSRGHVTVNLLTAPESKVLVQLHTAQGLLTEGELDG